MFNRAEFLFLLFSLVVMGNHRKRKRSAKAVSREHFPLGDLAKRRKEIKDQYLEKCKLLKKEKHELDYIDSKVSNKYHFILHKQEDYQIQLYA